MTQLAMNLGAEVDHDRAELIRKSKTSNVYVVWCWLDGKRTRVGDICVVPGTRFSEPDAYLFFDLAFAQSADAALRQRVRALTLAALRGDQ